MISASPRTCICFHLSSRKSEVNRFSHLHMNCTDTSFRMKESAPAIDSARPLLMKAALLLFMPQLNAITIIWLQ